MADAGRIRNGPMEIHGNLVSDQNVTFHPTVLEWIREHSGASFIWIKKAEDAAFYLEHGLIFMAQGDVVDPVTRKPTGEALYTLTKKALRLAYPDGVNVPRYKCTVCGKETAGKFDRYNNWLPRKHRIDGEVCAGSNMLAKIVMRRKTF